MGPDCSINFMLTINEPKLVRESKAVYDEVGFMINHDDVDSEGVLLDTELISNNIFNLRADDGESSVSKSSQNISEFFNQAKFNALNRGTVS